MENIYDKIYEEEIRKGERENGYLIKYDPRDFFSCTFEKIGKGFTVTETNGRITRHENYSKKEIKKICYDKTKDFLKMNTQIKFGKVYSNSAFILKNSCDTTQVMEEFSEKAIDNIRNASMNNRKIRFSSN